MEFFFVRDSRRRPRFLSSGPMGPMPAGFSRTRAVWEKAKDKVTGLNPRTLLQEQAFERADRVQENPLRILTGGFHDEKKLRHKFYFFLQRQRTRHVLVLAGEALVVPVSAVAALLPGPNIIFYFLAVLMIIQWQALRGITRIIKRDWAFEADPLLATWEDAVEAGATDRFAAILSELERTRGLQRVRKALWK